MFKLLAFLLIPLSTFITLFILVELDDRINSRVVELYKTETYLSHNNDDYSQQSLEAGDGVEKSLQEEILEAVLEKLIEELFEELLDVIDKKKENYIKVNKKLVVLDDQVLYKSERRFINGMKETIKVVIDKTAEGKHANSIITQNTTQPREDNIINIQKEPEHKKYFDISVWGAFPQEDRMVSYSETATESDLENLAPEVLRQIEESIGKKALTQYKSRLKLLRFTGYKSKAKK